MTDINEIVRRNIAHFRREKGFSQEQLALETGIHRAYIGFIETGRRPVNLRHLQKIAGALNIKIEDLLKDYPNEN